jgi:hypothetical protein
MPKIPHRAARGTEALSHKPGTVSFCLLLQRCPADTFSPGGTQVECLPCPINSVAPQGSTSPGACVPKPGFGLVNGTAVLPVGTAISSTPSGLLIIYPTYRFGVHVWMFLAVEQALVT